MAGKDLSRNAAKEVHVADVIRHGDKLIVPEKMKLAQAIELLHRRMKFEEEKVELNETFDCFPWDGAHALDAVLVATFGWSPAETRPGGFFTPPQPPQLISVEVAPGEVKSIPWGLFSLPTVDGLVECSVSRKDGMVRFALNATVRRKDESTIKKLFDDVRSFIAENSIYRGKAIKLRFRDDSGDVLPMPEPKFINTTFIDPSELIYSRDIENSIRTNLFTPIERVDDCIRNGIPVKRGIMLAGAYGTGKTLGARIAAKLAVDNGLTYVSVLRADEFQDAINFARLYGKPACVLFCEDIDRALNGERTVKIDDILNTLDGVDSKNMNLITVLTSNHIENVNAAMLRPGRLDAIIEVTAPDAEAVDRLIRRVAGDSLSADTDISEACAMLEGNVPAVLTEVVKRAKLSQLTRQAPGTLVTHLTGEALKDAAFTMTRQNELLRKASEPKPGRPDLDAAFREAVGQVVKGTDPSAGGLKVDAKVKLENGLGGTIQGSVQ